MLVLPVEVETSSSRTTSDYVIIMAPVRFCFLFILLCNSKRYSYAFAIIVVGRCANMVANAMV